MTLRTLIDAGFVAGTIDCLVTCILTVYLHSNIGLPDANDFVDVIHLLQSQLAA